LAGCDGDHGARVAFVLPLWEALIIAFEGKSIVTIVFAGAAVWLILLLMSAYAKALDRRN
jgi:hypothetical protein